VVFFLVFNSSGFGAIKTCSFPAPATLAAVHPPPADEAIMSDRFLNFLLLARWTSALVALMYHVRFLAFVNYDAVEEKNILLTGFYFLTGLGHESYAAFFILDGLLAGLILHRQRARLAAQGSSLSRHAINLYRLMLPGLVLGAVFDYGGVRLFYGTGVYTDFPEFSTLALGYAPLLGNLFMLQPFVVPNFGGNSMLYLLSYLFWALVLLVLFVRAAGLPAPWRQLVRLALLAAVLLLMPYKFLIWTAIWLAGVGLVFLAEARAWRPPVPVALLLCGGAVLLSRMLGPATRGMDPLLRDWAIQLGFLGAGLGFAVLAWAVYPKRQAWQRDSRAYPALRAAEGWPAQAASFTFFFHFPVIMLLAAMGDARLGQPLMQQPTVSAFAWFGCLALASVVVAACATGVLAALLRTLAALAQLLAGRRSGRGTLS
jgi:hypothetical protein